MPLVWVCTDCKKPINEEKEDYYVTNKQSAQNKDQWMYAHLECPVGTRPKGGVVQGPKGYQIENIEPTGKGG
jgi:hypothetical protein